MNEKGLICQIAQQRLRNATLWRNLWTILLFIFGAAVIAFLAYAIFVLLEKAGWKEGGLAVLGAVVNSVGVKWVVARRTEAKNEEVEAYKEVEEHCGDVKSIDGLRKQLKLFWKFR